MGKFGDLDKSVSDFFTDVSDEFDQLKLTLKSKAKNGVTIKVEGKKKASGPSAVDGKIESSYTFASGLAVKEKWDTKNTVTTELAYSNLLAKGTKFVGELQFSPNSGIKKRTIKADYCPKGSALAINTKTTDFSKINAEAVYTSGKFAVGAAVEHSASKGTTSCDFGARFTDADLSAATKVLNGGAKVVGSIEHSASDKVTSYVQFTYGREDSSTSFQFGGAFDLDNGAQQRAYVTDAGSVGLYYSQELRKGVSMGLAAQVNAMNLGGDAHQVGVSFELNN